MTPEHVDDDGDHEQSKQQEHPVLDNINGRRDARLVLSYQCIGQRTNGRCWRCGIADCLDCSDDPVIVIFGDDHLMFAVFGKYHDGVESSGS